MSNPENKCEHENKLKVFGGERCSKCFELIYKPVEPSIEETEEEKLIIELIANNQTQQKILREQIESLDRLLVIMTNMNLRNERNRHG